MFLTIAQQSYCYTKLCNYRDMYLNLLVTYQTFLCVAIKFHQVLKCSLLSNGWIIFSRLNTIKKLKKCLLSFIFNFTCCVNFLLWKKITTVIRPTTLRVLLMGRSGYPTKRGNWGGGGSLCKSEILNFPLLLDKSTYWEIPHLGKKGLSNSF